MVVYVSCLPISEQEFLDEIFEASTYSSRITFDETFLFFKTFKDGILQVSRKIEASDMLHKVHMFLIPKMHEHWTQFLLGSLERCGSIKLFMKMMECDVEYTLKNFTRLFTQVKFYEAKTLDDEKLVNQCMEMILKSPLVTEYEVYGRNINCPWLILNQTGNLKFVIDLMKAYPACSKYGGISVTELMRTYNRSSLSWDEQTSTQYLVFLKKLLNTRADDDYLSNLNTICEAMAHNSEFTYRNMSGAFQIRWMWFFQKIQQILEHYLDKVKFDKNYTHIRTILVKIQKESGFQIHCDLLLKKRYAQLYKIMCHFTNPTPPPFVQVQEKYDNLRCGGVDILSRCCVWGPFPIETINNICHKKQISVYNLTIKTCLLSDLSHLSGFDQFKSLAPVTTTTDNDRIIAYIEQFVGEIDKSQKMIIAIPEGCQSKVLHFGEVILEKIHLNDNKYYHNDSPIKCWIK
jgi:hypothetical protein